jgi:hypothetical protein
MLISLLIAVIVAGLIFWVVGLLPLPQPWLNIVKVLVILIFLVWLLSSFVALPGSPHLLRY